MCNIINANIIYLDINIKVKNGNGSDTESGDNFIINKSF